MGVLVTLKNSDRNSSLLDSLSRKSLWMEPRRTTTLS